jgi:hypothetical protein
MKKIAVVAAGVLSLGYLGAFDLPALDVNTSVKFSSEHAVRGRKQGAKVFAPKAEVGYQAFEKGRVYVGTWAAVGLDGRRFSEFDGSDKSVTLSLPVTCNEVDPYFGMSYDVTDMFTVDVGYIHHIYANLPKMTRSYVAGASVLGEFKAPSGLKRDRKEIYLGVLADVLLSPSAYFFYDFDSREAVIEGRIAYTYDLSQFGVNGVAIDLGAKLGFDKTSKPFGLPLLKGDGKKSSVYYGVNADLIYSFNENAKVRAGVEFAGNGAKKTAWQNNFPFAGKHKSLVWFNASVDCSF